MGIREERFDRAAHMPHRKLAGDNRLDAHLESRLGRLFFEGKISKDEYEAGVKYARFGLQYLETIDAPGGELPEIHDDVCLRRKLNFLAARSVLAERGSKCARVVDRVIIYDEPLRDGELEIMRAGLRALCGQHFLRLVAST